MAEMFYDRMLLSLEQCKWQKHLNQIICQHDGTFPREVRIVSPKTNDHRTYVHLTENDPRQDQDGWDGEQMVYRTHTSTNNAEYLVLYRGS